MFYKSFVLVMALLCIGCSAQDIKKLDMQLSAFGVESDRVPNIDATIDFEKGTSVCKVSYYYPDYKPFEYSLTKEELDEVLKLLEKTNLDSFKENYTVGGTDQPTATTIIYTDGKTYTIKDYGLKGDDPLWELYSLVFKWEKTIKKE